MRTPRHSRLNLACYVLFLLLVLVACQNPLAEAVATIKATAVSPTAELTDPSGTSLGTGGGIDLGSVGLSSTRDISFTITNSGKTALVIDAAASKVTPASGTEAGAITIQSLPASIEPGKTGTVVLRLTRQAASGTKTATLVLRTNDVAHPDISLTLSGVSLDGAAKEITAFGFDDPDLKATGIISGTDITVFVPDDGSPLVMRSPVFETTGSVVKVGSAVQTSGDSASHQDFSAPVTYRVTSLDGASFADYEVSVVRNPKAPALVPHDRTIEASWTAVPNATGYQVWYYAGTDPTKAAKFGASVTSGTTASITGLTNSIAYTVWIKAEYASGLVSGLGLASTPATVNIKYYGWLYTGYNSGGQVGVGQYGISTIDGSLSGAGSLVSSDLASKGVTAMAAMAVDKVHGFLFYAHLRDNHSNPPYMVRSARIDPVTGALTENAAVMETSWMPLVSLAVSADGAHLYGICGYISGSAIYYWDVDPVSGALSNQRSVSEGFCLMGMGIHPTKNLLYVVQCSSDASAGIRFYDLDPSTGAPTFNKWIGTYSNPTYLSLSPDSGTMYVSYTQSDSAPVQIYGLAAYPLPGSGLPSALTPLWSSPMATAHAVWRRPLCFLPPGSSSPTIFAFESMGTCAVKALDGSGVVSDMGSTGSSLSATDFVTLPSGAVYVYASRVGASLVSYKASAIPGHMDAGVDTTKGIGCEVVSALILPW